MGSSLRSGDIIYESIRVVAVRIVVLHGHFHVYIILFPFAVNDLVVQRRLAFIQVCDKFLDSTLIMEGLLPDLFLTHIPQDDLKALCQKCHLAESLF